MNTRSRALRIVLATALTLGITGLGLGLAESASASTSFPSSSPVTPIAGHQVDTGVIVINFDPSQAGLTVAVVTPDPADLTAISTQTGVIGADGSVSIRNFAGPASVYRRTSDGQVQQLGSSPLPGSVVQRQAASIYRGQTFTYSYSSDTDTFTFVSGPMGGPVPPSAQDVLTQIPTTQYTVTSSDAIQGASTTVTFSSVTPNGIGDPNYRSSVVYYAYGAPDALGSSVLSHGTIRFFVPAIYSYGEHVVAGFDNYGRLVARTIVGSTAMPPAPAGSTAAAHPLDTGTVLIQMNNVLPGSIVTSTVADPTAPGTFSVVNATVGHGFIAAITNFAGPSRIDVEPTVPGQYPGPLTGEVNIYRAQYVRYGYPSVSNTGTDPFGMFGQAPAPIIPSSAEEAEQLTPVATSTVSPASWQAGSDVTLDVTNVTPTSVTDDATLNLDNYVYSTPTLLGSSTISLNTAADAGGHAYSFTVPGAFTSGGHVAASFDQFGRLVTLDHLDGATAAGTPASPDPGTNAASGVASTTASDTTAATGANATTAANAAHAAHAALANTGQNDLIPAGIAAMVLFGAGAIVFVMSRRRASTRRD